MAPGWLVFHRLCNGDLWASGSGTTTNRFAYDGDSIWADLNGSNGLLMRYILGDQIDQMLARISGSGTAAWYLTDRLGSVRDITDNTGAIIDHINYDGFGNVTQETQTANGDRWKWTGREFDSETGFQYNRVRYYDPRTGRWTSQDPIGFGAGDGNLYRYAGNMSTDATDPTGVQGQNSDPDRQAIMRWIMKHERDNELAHEVSKTFWAENNYRLHHLKGDAYWRESVRLDAQLQEQINKAYEQKIKEISQNRRLKEFILQQDKQEQKEAMDRFLARLKKDAEAAEERWAQMRKENEAYFKEKLQRKAYLERLRVQLMDMDPRDDMYWDKYEIYKQKWAEYQYDYGPSGHKPFEPRPPAPPRASRTECPAGRP